MMLEKELILRAQQLENTLSENFLKNINDEKHYHEFYILFHTFMIVDIKNEEDKTKLINSFYNFYDKFFTLDEDKVRWYSTYLTIFLEQKNIKLKRMLAIKEKLKNEKHLLLWIKKMFLSFPEYLKEEEIIFFFKNFLTKQREKAKNDLIRFVNYSFETLLKEILIPFYQASFAKKIKKQVFEIIWRLFSTNELYVFENNGLVNYLIEQLITEINKQIKDDETLENKLILFEDIIKQRLKTPDISEWIKFCEIGNGTTIEKTLWIFNLVNAIGINKKSKIDDDYIFNLLKQLNKYITLLINKHKEEFKNLFKHYKTINDKYKIVGNELLELWEDNVLELVNSNKQKKQNRLINALFSCCILLERMLHKFNNVGGESSLSVLICGSKNKKIITTTETMILDFFFNNELGKLNIRNKLAHGNVEKIVVNEEITYAVIYFTMQIFYRIFIWNFNPKYLKRKLMLEENYKN